MAGDSNSSKSELGEGEGEGRDGGGAAECLPPTCWVLAPGSQKNKKEDELAIGWPLSVTSA